ncbi:MAG: AI-2E family transporter [Elusimicrobiota bacterium]|jgi:predicted PurR-regulated permease PerM
MDSANCPASLRKISYLLLAALFMLIIAYKLGPALIAGVFSYTIIDAAYKRLASSIPPAYAKWAALGIFTVAATFLAWMFGRFIHQSIRTIPDILTQALPKVNEIALRYRIGLPFESVADLRQALIEALKENTGDITHAGGIITRGFFHIIVGIFIAALCFMSEKDDRRRPDLYDALRRMMNEQLWKFMQSFERVLGAQVIISAINTSLTAIFLLALDFPHIAFLVPATFFIGILPVIGNLLSNTIIVCTALTISPHHAAFALCFLIVIHKGEYFLNSRIIGSSIHAPMWQTLLGILVGEVILGVPGIILAPAVMHYVRQELRDIPQPS